MKKYLLFIVILLAGCSVDNIAVTEAFPETDYVFDENQAEFILLSQYEPNEQVPLVLEIVTTYEQASFLRRNADWLSERVRDGELTDLRVSVGERYEMDNEIYYSIEIIAYYTQEQVITHNYNEITLNIAGREILTKPFVKGDKTTIEDIIRNMEDTKK